MAARVETEDGKKDHLKVHVATWNLGNGLPPTETWNGSEDNWRRFVEMRHSNKNSQLKARWMLQQVSRIYHNTTFNKTMQQLIEL